MGGSISVTVREENGQEHRMCRWTNSLPWFMKNIRLLNKDPAHLKEYLKAYKHMQADYAEHKDLKKFSHEMTNVYAPYPFLAPHDYGLVVVDMQTNHILDYQGYTSPDVIDAVSISLEMNSNADASGVVSTVFGGDQPERLGKRAFYLKDDEFDAVRFRELFEASRITEARDYLKGQKVQLGKSLDDVIALIKEDKKRILYFPIDMSPYKVIRYREQNPKAAIKMKKKIADLGFILSSQENEIWDKWIKELEENR